MWSRSVCFAIRWKLVPDETWFLLYCLYNYHIYIYICTYILILLKSAIPTHAATFDCPLWTLDPKFPKMTWIYEKVHQSELMHLALCFRGRNVISELKNSHWRWKNWFIMRIENKEKIVAISIPEHTHTHSQTHTHTHTHSQTHTQQNTHSRIHTHPAKYTHMDTHIHIYSHS